MVPLSVTDVNTTGDSRVSEFICENIWAVGVYFIKP